MSLAFLVPLFLVAVAGVVVPVMVHLTRRQRRNVVHFPSLMFLEKIPYQEQRRRRIQHWFLLSLRALALLLVVAAFARPFVDQSETGGLGSAGPREVVVLVDQSYSMDAGDQLERARSEALRVFNDLGPLDRASLVTFSRGAQVVVRSTSDRIRLRGAVDTIAASSGVTRYGPALKVAQTILEESTLARGEVYLLSDFQRNGWSGDEGVQLPPGSTVIPFSVGDDSALDNVMVTDVSLPRQSVSGRERITPTARIVRRGGTEARTVIVTLEIDGQELQTRETTLAPDAATAVTFAPFTLSRPHTTGTVRLPDDALPADNAHHFVLSPGTSLNVLVAEGQGAARDVSLYVAGALGISDDGRFNVRRRRSSSIRPVDLDGISAVFLNDIQIDGGSAERIRTFVEAGGGVFIALGQDGGWPASAADMLPGTVGDMEDRIQGRGGRLGYLDYEHPIFEVFAGARSGDFTGARFYRARRLEPADSATVLARFDDGSVALAELRIGRGKVLLWTTSLDAFWNDLALQPVYLPFVHRVAEYLGGRAESVPWFVAGQVVDLADPDALEMAGLVSSEAAGLVEGLDQVALGPTGESTAMPEGAGPRYLPLEDHGFYTVRQPGSNPDRPFVMAVNVDLEESNLSRMDTDELALQIEVSPAARGAGPTFGETVELQRADQERRQQLWRWLLFAALGLFVLETAISNWVSRKSLGAAGGVVG
jgi:aerotolerance regulator-like protein/VWA domain-containing protein